MRSYFKVLVVSAFLLMVSSGMVYAADCNSRCCADEYPSLTVQGEGKIETLADKVNFIVNIRVEEKKLDKAFEESTKRINSLSQILTSSGVKKEDIRNLGYVYHPLYEGKKIFTTIDRPSSYEVIYRLKVTVYNLDNLGKILTSLSEIPESTVTGVEYTSTKIEELRREVLNKAAADAYEKAKKLAAGAGATLGKAKKIQSGFQGYLARQDYKMEDRAMEFSSMVMKEKAAPQMESGYLEIIGNCSIEYALQ